MYIPMTCIKFLRQGFKLVPVLTVIAVPAFAQNAAPSPAPTAAPAAEQAPYSQKFLMSEAMRLAYLNNPSLNSGRADLLATHELLPQAQAGFKPSITADADITHSASETDIDDDSGTPKSVGLSLTQPVYRGGRTVAQSAVARYTIASRAQLLRAQEQDIFESVATAYMDVMRDEAVLELRQQNQDLLTRQLKATSDRFEVGELTKTDVSQSNARVSEAEANVIDAQGNLNSSRAVFEQVVGAPPTELCPCDVDLTVPDTLSDVTAMAEENSPVVLSAINAHRAAEEDVDNVYGELLPQVGFFATYDHTRDPVSTFTDDRTDRAVGIEASIPLYEAGSVRSRVREAKYTANSRYLDILDAKRQAREAAIRNWEDLQAARAQIKSREAQVEAARIAQEGVRQEAEFGARTILDALDADQELLDAQVALVVARRDEVVAQFSLLATLGLLSPETFGFGSEAIVLDGNVDKVQRKVFDMDVDRVGQPG